MRSEKRIKDELQLFRVLHGAEPRKIIESFRVLATILDDVEPVGSGWLMGLDQYLDDCRMALDEMEEKENE